MISASYYICERLLLFNASMDIISRDFWNKKRDFWEKKVWYFHETKCWSSRYHTSRYNETAEFKNVIMPDGAVFVKKNLENFEICSKRQ